MCSRLKTAAVRRQAPERQRVAPGAVCLPEARPQEHAQAGFQGLSGTVSGSPAARTGERVAPGAVCLPEARPQEHAQREFS
ncbi:MAG: hypothetical protein K2P59_08090 [Acetatifactor sp.]|nr:hypothetical protein [Acetatifactor sp.]